jgi:hypothetical protein
MTLPSPAPRPTSGNAVPSAWQCSNTHADVDPALNMDYEPTSQSCVITAWASTGSESVKVTESVPLVVGINSMPAVTVQNTPLPVQLQNSSGAPSNSEGVATAAYPGGYTYDESNWSDIGPWFASMVFAVVLAPYAFQTFMKWIRESFNV